MKRARKEVKKESGGNAPNGGRIGTGSGMPSPQQSTVGMTVGSTLAGPRLATASAIRGHHNSINSTITVVVSTASTG